MGEGWGAPSLLLLLQRLLFWWPQLAWEPRLAVRLQRLPVARLGAAAFCWRPTNPPAFASPRVPPLPRLTS